MRLKLPKTSLEVLALFRFLKEKTKAVKEQYQIQMEEVITYQFLHRGPCFVHNRAAKFDSPTTLQTMPSIVVVQQMQTPAASPQAEMVHMLPEIAHATVSAKKSNKMTSTKKKGAYCF